MKCYGSMYDPQFENLSSNRVIGPLSEAKRYFHCFHIVFLYVRGYNTKLNLLGGQNCMLQQTNWQLIKEQASMITRTFMYSQVDPVY